MQTAERLVRENPAGWQGTASELTGWVKEFTGVSYTAQSLSHQIRNLRDAFSKYDDIIYQPASYAGNSRRVHALYKKLTVC